MFDYNFVDWELHEQEWEEMQRVMEDEYGTQDNL